MSGIVEIAKKAGVSPATVSRALRGMHHVNERTRKKIIDAAQALDYPIRPDLLPRSEGSRTNTIGVVAPYLSRWFFSQAIAGVEQALREAGMDLLLYNFAQIDARQRVFQQKKLSGKVDGLIVISMPPTEREFETMLGLGIPVALLGVTDSRCSSVAIDDVTGASTAVEHLIANGHKDIAILKGQDDSTFNFQVSSMRFKGYLDTLASHNIEFNRDFELTCDFDSHTAELAMDEFLGRKKLPTAIFCQSDEMAYGVIKSLNKRGMQAGKDISVIGFDDHEYAEIAGLTTVQQSVQFQGQIAASEIMAQLEKPDSKNTHIKVPTQLVIRNTVAKI